MGMLRFLQERELGSNYEKLNVLKIQLSQLRQKYGFYSSNQTLPPEGELLQNIFFNGNLMDMSLLLSIYAYCPKVRDYDEGMISSLRNALDSFRGNIRYRDQSEDFYGDKYILEDIAHQIRENISKIETPQTREMLKLVLTALHITDTKLPSVMKNSYVITKLWAEITKDNDQKPVMRASL